MENLNDIQELRVKLASLEQKLDILNTCNLNLDKSIADSETRLQNQLVFCFVIMGVNAFLQFASLICR